MRPCVSVIFAALVCGCASPLAAAIPAAVGSQQRDSVAVPSGDGSHYVMVESGPRVSDGMLNRSWERKATRACKGEYLVLSHSVAARRKNGLLASRIQEGYVRCISPEAVDEEPPKKPIAATKRRG